MLTLPSPCLGCCTKCWPYAHCSAVLASPAMVHKRNAVPPEGIGLLRPRAAKSGKGWVDATSVVRLVLKLCKRMRFLCDYQQVATYGVPSTQRRQRRWLSCVNGKKQARVLAKHRSQYRGYFRPKTAKLSIENLEFLYSSIFSEKLARKMNRSPQNAFCRVI
jgi:hypothetical protein